MLVRSPIYEQLNTALRQMIVAGDVAIGEQFLTERQVSERFEVSRNTANKALSSLVSEGLLEFRKGVGTFVLGTLDYDLSQLVSFTEKATTAGLTPSTTVRTFRKTSAAEVPDEILQQLHLLQDGAAYQIERLRLADQTPVIDEQRFVVAQHCPGLKKRDVNGSLYRLFTEQFALNVTGADETITAVALSKEEAARLGVRSRSPALEVTTVGYVNDGIPLWWERTLYRADVYQFRNRIAGLHRTGPAVGELTVAANQRQPSDKPSPRKKSRR